MNIEKTIKKQSRASLKNNWLNAVSGVFLLSASALISYLTAVLLGYAGNIWDKDGLLKSGNDVYFTVVICAAVLAAILLSPFKNGFYKLCYNISLTGDSDFSDVFYFFKRNNYISTLVFNLVISLKLLLRFALGLIPYFVVKALTAFFSVELLTTVTANDIFSIAEIILFILGCVIGIILSASLFTYEFAYIEFENNFEDVFKTSKLINRKYRKNIFKLFFSFAPWIALCFFVLPALYTAPYIATSFADSSKWLIKLYKEGKME